MQNTIKLSLITALILSSAVHAEEAFRQHEAHVHGHVAFNIAQDGSDLLVEIHAPGADVVGFEHAPETDQQHKQLDSALNVLNDAHNLLSFTSAADCSVSEVHVQHTLGKHHDDDAHDHDHADEHHDNDDHDHDHADEHHDDGDHDHDHADEHHDDNDHDHAHEHEHEHGEFKIEYLFHCENMEQLQQIDTAWFTHFPNTQEIDVNLLTDKQQNALELNKNNPVIKL